MAKPQAAPPPKSEDEREEEDTPLLNAMLEDVSPEGMATMRDHLAGKGKPLGPNVACNGFFKKWPGAQLIGQVMTNVTRPNSFNPENEDEILFVRGFALYPEDVKTKSGKTTLITKGEYQGTFGFQIDAGTMALSGSGRGSRVHLKVKEMIDLSGGRTRWTYDFVRPG